MQRTPEQEAEQEAVSKLVRQCIAGDPQAWQQLVVSQHRRIYAICYRFTGSASDAEDLTQDVFLKLYKNLSSFDTLKGSFQTWITTLARNLLVDHFRRTRLDRASESLDATLGDDENGPSLADRLADPRPSQEHHVAGLELKVKIQIALKQLSPELREAVILRDLEDMDYKEIAQVLRIPEGTVKSRISRGRGELARLLQRIEGQVILVPTNKQDLNQFGSAKPTQSGDPQHCAQCEAMLTDALDGTLSPADQAAFDLHLLSCTPCSSMMADAQRGAAWLEMLKSPRPEPPAALLDRILAQTSSATSAHTTPQPVSFLVPSNTLLGRPALSSSGISLSASAASNVIPFRSRFAAFNLRSIGHTLLQPRLAMTAAMAFFSIALTLNLAGVRISELRASDLRPSSLKRSFYEANAHVVRYYDNLRVVYELESRVHDLQNASDSDSDSTTPAPAAAPSSDSTTKPAQKPAGNQPAAQPDQQQEQDKKQDKQSRPRPSPGTSRRESPLSNLHQVVADGQLHNPLFSPLPYLPQPLATLLPGLKPGTTSRRVQEGRLV